VVIGLRVAALAMTLHVGLLGVEPMWCASFAPAGGSETPKCCRTGRDATCPMHETKTPAPVAPAPDHAAAKLCGCFPADLGLAITGLVGPVIPRLVVVPDRASVTAQVVADDSGLDIFPIPPAPPPKPPIALL